MSKQTATDWLFEKLWDTPKDRFTWNALLKEANEMHEQQIMEAYMKAKLEHIDTLGLNAKKNQIINDTEQYYNETYKKD